MEDCVMGDVPDEKTKKITKKLSRFKQALSGFNKRYIDDAVKFYLDRNVDPMIISGIFGNISQESGWDPLASSKDNGLGDFYGLVLMSPNMRNEVKRVYGKVDANTTHQFIYDAMTGNKKISEPWRRYMTEKGGYWNNKYHDAGTAAMAFGNVFERPSERYANWDERMRSASDAYDYVMQIVNAKNEANKKSFANPIKTTVAADGNKVMTVNPEYWEQQGMLLPVQKLQIEQPILQSTQIQPKRILPINVAPAPWDLNLQVLNRGIEVTPRKSPFSLSLSLPKLDDLLALNTPLRLMQEDFADILGISDMLPLAPSLFPRLKNGKLPRFGDGTPTDVRGYRVWPSAVGASELNITVPDVVVTGTDRRPMYQRYDAENSTYDPNAVRNFTDFAPIVGDIGQGLDLYRALENLNYSQAAALGGLLLLPNAIEKSGKTILKAGLKYAPDITKNIYDISKLYTKVEDNPRLRRYANDVVDLLKSKQISERVAESIDNVDIAKQISNISNTPVTFYHSNSGKVWIRPIITLKPLGINREFRSIIPKYGKYAGNYDPIGKKVFIKRSGRNPEQIKQTTYHETSHASDNAFPESVGIKFYDRKTNVEGVTPYFDQSTEKRARLLSILTDAFKHDVDINNKSAIEEFITSPNYTNNNLNSLLNNYKYLDVESDFYDLLDNGYKNGKLPGEKISIKPANRGKFTALKKRTGHSASWFKAHGTPALKKMATFALNARKWKH